MIDFKKLTMNDIEIVRPYFAYSRSNSCDNTVGGSVMWADYFNTRYAIIDRTLLFKVSFTGYGECYTVPIGEAVSYAINLICNECKEMGTPMQFVAATERDTACVEKKFDVEKVVMQEWSDYVYNADDLINLSGRKYHGQKNHINFFKKTFPDYSYEEINNDNIKYVKEFLERFAKTESKESMVFEEELKKTFEVLDNNDKYKFFGLILKVSGTIIAFSMGEKINHTLFAHIEKADKKYRGSYPMIMNEFAKRFGSDMKYINREENAGDKGLESSKLQYHPCTILNKHYLKVKCDKC
ncbi:MAG: DUF2156 domain-containing protein [Lachnospiraceae bacterium]|nr:DUF2156 domain-containing protein [Lachnospiraceae bacterium]